MAFAPSMSKPTASWPLARASAMSSTVSISRYSFEWARSQSRIAASMRRCCSMPSSPKPTLTITTSAPASRWRCSCGRKAVSCGVSGMQAWLSHTSIESTRRRVEEIVMRGSRRAAPSSIR